MLFVGALQPRKNAPALIEAFARLRGHDDLELVLAGGDRGGLAEVRERIARSRARHARAAARPRLRGGAAGALLRGLAARVPVPVRGVRAAGARGDGLWHSGLRERDDRPRRGRRRRRADLRPDARPEEIAECIAAAARGRAAARAVCGRAASRAPRASPGAAARTRRPASTARRSGDHARCRRLHRLARPARPARAVPRGAAASTTFPRSCSRTSPTAAPRSRARSARARASTSSPRASRATRTRSSRRRARATCSC